MKNKISNENTRTLCKKITKVNKKDTKSTTMRSFWYLYCYFSPDLEHCSGVCIAVWASNCRLVYFFEAYNTTATCIALRSELAANVVIELFNRDLNRDCLGYILSLRFSGSTFLINLRRQLRVRQIFFYT